MPVRPLKLTTLTPGTIATFDLLASGEWIEHHDILDVAAKVCVVHEVEASLKNGRRVRRKWLAKGHTLTDPELIESGARDLIRNRLMIAIRSGRVERTGTLHRMLPETISEWALLRPHCNPEHLVTQHAPSAAQDATAPENTSAQDRPRRILHAVPDLAPETTAAPAQTAAAQSDTPGAEPATTRRNTRTSEPRVFGGIPEEEGWLAAPLATFARVHWRTKYQDIDTRDLARDLPSDVHVSYDESEGLYRVDCEPGTEIVIREAVRAWFEDRDIEIKSLRAEPHTRLRNIDDLDPNYLSDLYKFYSIYATGRLRRHVSTLQFHYSDPDDLKQQVALWILRAVRTFDNTKSVPFGAYLSAQLSSWVHDLNRNKYGRAATDAERNIHRVHRDFVAEHGRPPSDTEAATLLGQSVETYRKNAQVVASLQGMRNAATLDAGSADDEYEVVVADPEDAETQLLVDDRNTHLSRVLLAACEIEETGHARSRLIKEPNVLGLVAWYEKIWGNGTKGDLALSLDTSMRNLNVYADRVEARMQERRDEFATQ